VLDFMRKHANSWFVSLIIGAIVVVFVLWGIGTMRSAQFQKVAEVDGNKIYLPEYLRAYQNLIRTYQERLGGDFNEEAVKAMNLKAQTLNQLIDEVLIRQAAKRLGLVVTDAELRQHIVKIPAFNDERGFNERRYQQLLARQRIPASDFEASERQRLLFQKVVGFITSFAKVSEADLQETYRLEHEAVSVNYLVVSPAAFLKEQQVTPEEVAAFYNQHQELFREPEKVQFRYTLLKFRDFEAKIKTDPAKIETFYYDHLDEFSEPKAIRVHEIVLNVPAGAPAADRQALRQIADAILKNAQAGVPFDQLVKKYSQLPGLQIKADDLGVVKRGQKLPDWETAAFKLKKGESGLAVTPTGFHIMQVQDILENNSPPLAAIQPQVEKAWRAAEARQLARQQAAALRDESLKSSFTEVLKQHQAPLQETPLLTAREPIPGLGPQPAVSQAFQSLKSQEISQPIVLPEGVVLLQLVNRQESILPPLDQIRNKVAEAARLDKAREAASQEAKKMLARLRQGETLAKVAAAKGLTVQDSGYFTRPQGFHGHPQARNLTSAAFSLTGAGPYPPEPISQGGENFLLAFKDRRPPNPEQFAQARTEMQKSLLDIKRQIVFSQWLAEERQHASIKVYEVPS
jgi:peptidyl-prolyl cis-trans isomerase D